MKRKILMTLSLLAGIAAGARAQQTAVTAREGTLELPTYVLNAADTAPIFERDWSYQRAAVFFISYGFDSLCGCGGAVSVVDADRFHFFNPP